MCRPYREVPPRIRRSLHGTRAVAELSGPRPVAIIGLGCIGGSLARALVAQEVEVRGWSPSASDREQAASARVLIPADERNGIAEACAGAGIVVLATPIHTVGQATGTVHAHLARNAQLLHVCGLQSRSALGLDEELHDCALGTHPLAGSHDSGFGASRPELFVDAVVSAETRASARARQCIEWLWHTVGVQRIDYRTAESHDRLMAWVSQLPQLAATALAATLAAGGVDARTVGTGARDTTRLAASDLGSWPALFRGAPRDLDEALGRLGEMVAELRTALGNGDSATIDAIWSSARSWRREGAATTGPRSRMEAGEERGRENHL